METILTDKQRWREVYRQQRLKNAHLWLEELEKTADPVALATANYDKLLQAIEQTLNHEDSFSVGCDLLREITPIAFGMSDWSRLLIYLKGALSNSKQLSSLANVAYLHEWIADIELLFTNLDAAEAHFNKALQLYLDEGETVRYGRILPRLARVYAAKGQLLKCVELCESALSLGLKANEKIIIADAHFALADYYYRSNNWEKALEQCERACFNYVEVGNQSFIFRTRVFAVTYKVYLKRYVEAKAESDQLLILFKNSKNAYDNLIDSIHLRRTIGFMHFMLEEYVLAEQHWQEAYNQNMLIGAPDMAASLGNNLGKVYTKLKEYEAAEQMLLDALTNFDQLGDVTRWANCMDNLADLYEEIGDLQACKRTLEQAITRLKPDATLEHSQKLLKTMQHRLECLEPN